MVLAACVSACTFPDITFVNFDDVEGFDQSLFKITSTKTTDIQEALESAATKTTYTSATAFVQKMLAADKSSKVIEIAGTYDSIDHNGNVIRLSGKVIIPTNAKAERYILVSHYTIGSDAECPSRCFPIEGLLADMGYIMVFPDYEGFGATVDHIHPYLVMEQSAINVCDMMIAVRHLLAKTKYAPKYDDIYLMGYSQGGATTMATECAIETMPYYDFDIRGVFAGGGPYDINATYQSYIENNYCGYPYALPIVLQGMIVGNNLDIKITDLLQPRLAEKFDEWYSSKKYTTAMVNTFIGTKIASEILNEKGMDRSSPEIAELYKAMTENSVISLGWTPKAPVYMFHSIDDDTVPFLNASKAKAKWDGANIHYNFGNYGNHIVGAIRFVLTVKTFLATAQWEEYANMED